MQQLDGLQDKWLSAVAGAGGLEQLEALRVEALERVAAYAELDSR